MRAGSQEDLAGFIGLTGQVAGNQARATELLRRQNETMRRIEGIMSGSANLQRPRVVYFNRAAQTLRVGGKRSYSDFSIRVAGGQNVAAEIQAANAVTIEQVLT